MASKCPACGGDVERKIEGSAVNPTCELTCADCGSEIFNCFHCGDPITSSQVAATNRHYFEAMTGQGGPDGEFVLHRYCSDCEDKVPIDLDIESDELYEQMQRKQRQTLEEYGTPIPYATRLFSGVGAEIRGEIVQFYEEQSYYISSRDKEYTSDRWLLLSTDDGIEMHALYEEDPHFEPVVRYSVDSQRDAIDKMIRSIASIGNMGSPRQ